ncbi:hypothetical protein ACH5RR_006844 [Cinchona calisaya]|uniref:HAT C-terminal dimerisation domain-containing protein n=1 Tax=Cinchona calisaya TaxID=153742 RepID=A0ABD3AQ71_9GENT
MPQENLLNNFIPYISNELENLEIRNEDDDANHEKLLAINEDDNNNQTSSIQVPENNELMSRVLDNNGALLQQFPTKDDSYSFFDLDQATLPSLDHDKQLEEWHIMSSMGDNTNTTSDSPCPDLSSSSNPSGPSQSSSKVGKGKAAIPSLPPKDSKKINTSRYLVRSLMARDVPAIPVFTMVSELAFRAGGRVLDPFHSSLTPRMVEALICVQDWLRTSHEPLYLEEFLEELEEIEYELSSLTDEHPDVNIEDARIYSVLATLCSFAELMNGIGTVLLLEQN